MVLGKIKEGIDNAVDKAQDAADEAVDKAEEATGQDLDQDGSVGSKPEGAVDTDGDGKMDASRPPSSSGGKSTPPGAVDTDDDGQADASKPSHGSSDFGGSGGVSERAKSGLETIREQAESLAEGEKSTDEKVEQAEKKVEKEGFDEMSRSELQRELQENRNIIETDPGYRRRAEAFIQNTRAKSQAQEQRKQVDRQIEELKDARPGNYKLGRGEDAEVVSKNEAVEKLKNRKEELSGVVSEAEQNQKRAVDPPEPITLSEEARKQIIRSVDRNQEKVPDTSFSRAPGFDKKIEDLREQLGNQLTPEQREDIQDRIQDLQRRRNRPVGMPGGYTSIPGQSYLGRVGPENDDSILKNFGRIKSPELADADLEDYGPVAGAVRRLQVLATTEAGFEAPAAAALDPDRSFSDVVEEKSQEMASQDTGGGAVDLLNSPAGLVGTAGLGRLVGAGARGLQATRVGSGRLASAAGTGAKAAGAGLVGAEVGTGVKQYARGREAEGAGRVFRVGAEAGAFTRGLRNTYRKYGPQLGPSTRVSQDNFLRQIGQGDDAFLVGSGEMTARTPIVQRIPGKGSSPEDLKKVDEAVSSADYRIVADSSGSEAQGTLVDEMIDDSVQKQFQSLSRVQARQGDTILIQEGDNMQGFRLGEDEVATRDVLRTESEGRMFSYTDDTSRTTISRKEGETPVSEIRQLRSKNIDEPIEVEDAMGRKNIVGRLKADVIEQVKRGDINAKQVEFSSYSGGDDEVVTESSNLILNSKGSAEGGAGAGFSGGQGLRYGSRYQQGFVEESRRQVQAGQAFGARSRELAEDQLDSDSGRQAFASVEGGSGQQGQQAGMNEMAQYSAPQETRTRQVQESSSVQVQETDYSVEQVSPGQDFEDGSTGQQLSDGSQDLDRFQDRDLGVGTRQSQDQGQTQSTAQKLKQSMQQEFREGVKTGRGQSLRSPPRSRASSRLGSVSVPRMKLMPMTVQASGVKTMQRQNQRLTTPTVTSTNTYAPAAGLNLPGKEMSSASVSAGSSQGRNVVSSVSSGRNLDWFSANLVEQKGGEAVYDLSQQARNSLYGLKTVQERSGEVSQDKILDSGDEDDGGVDIW